MQIFAVLVAGGIGSRMKSEIPKQFLTLINKPVFIHTIEKFQQAIPEIQIILVLPEEHVATGQDLLNDFHSSANISITTGGMTRFHSVQNGLSCIRENGIVLVHDAVRCLVSTQLISKSVEACKNYGSAIPVVASKDSVRIKSDNQYKVADRNDVMLVQTPQVFHADILKQAFKAAYNDTFTDEATVVEHAGHTLHFVEGEINNIKITTPVDLLIAEQVILKQS